MVRTEGAFDQASSDLEASFLLSIWGCSRRLLRGLLRVETKQFTQSSQSCFSLFGSRRSGMKSKQNWLCWAVIRYFMIPHDTLQDLMSMSLLRLLPTLARRQRSRSLFFVRTLSTWLTAGSWYADMFVGAWQSGQGQRDRGTWWDKDITQLRLGLSDQYLGCRNESFIYISLISSSKIWHVLRWFASLGIP